MAYKVRSPAERHNSSQNDTASMNPEAGTMRMITTRLLNGEIERSTIQQEWDGHSSYQWTYFNETIKQFIELYLSKRLTGKNLDLGGGWYLHYPNSDIIDVSQKGLEYNIAPKERKYHFDLDTISRGARLPFNDRTFDSATMISVIQYLLDPWAVIKETGRVLKSSSELYIIGGQYAGVPELVVNNGFRSTEEMERSFASKGYDTLREPIPGLDGSIGEIESVIVAMPDENNVSRIKNKKTRLYAAKTFNSRMFIDEFTSREEETQVSKLRQIQSYPITKHSQSILENINKFTKAYNEKTGNNVILYYTRIPPDFYMSLPGKEPYLDLAVIAKNGSGYETIPEELEIYGVKYSQGFGFLPATEEVLKLALQNLDESEKQHLSNFLASLKLNKPALELSDRVEKALRESSSAKDIGYLQEVYTRTASILYCVAAQDKQRRRVDELIERKRYIESKPELIAGHGEIELDPYIPYLKEILRPSPLVAYDD